MKYTEQDLKQIAEYCEEHYLDSDAFLAYLDNIHNPDKWVDYADLFSDAFVGAYEDGESFAYEIVEELYSLPEIAKRYFDYASYWRDLEFGGEYWISDEGYIFRNY